jgi:hypothetical protein
MNGSMNSTKMMLLGIILMLLGVSLTSQLATNLYVQTFGFESYPPTFLVVLCLLLIVGGLVLGLIGFFKK